MYSFAPPRWVLWLLVALCMLAGGIAAEGCKYVAHHAQIGWKS